MFLWLNVPALLGSRGSSPFGSLPSSFPKIQRWSESKWREVHLGVRIIQSHNKVTFPIMNIPITNSSQMSQNDTSLATLLLHNVLSIQNNKKECSYIQYKSMKLSLNTRCGIHVVLPSLYRGSCEWNQELQGWTHGDR